MRRTVKESIIIVIVAALMGFVVNAFNPRGFRMTADTRPDAFQAQEISLSEAREKFQTGSSLFVDARSPEEFNEAHVPGAVNIRAYQGDSLLEDVKAHVTADDLSRGIVVYCSNRDCDSAGLAADAIYRAGSGNTIYVMKEGFDGWTGEGYPLEK